jgi:hypothetical protein
MKVKDPMIRGDSSEYDLLKNGVMKLKYILVNNYFHVGVDPYGNLKYQHYDDTGKYQCDYTDDMRDQMLKDFEPYIKTGKFSPCMMTDTDFMTYLNMQLVNLHLCIWMDLT